jgi:hypothetical protein
MVIVIGSSFTTSVALNVTLPDEMWNARTPHGNTRKELCPRLTIAVVLVHLRVIPAFVMQRSMQRRIKFPRLEALKAGSKSLVSLGFKQNVFLPCVRIK